MVSCRIWIDRSLRLGFPNSPASSRPRKRWPHWEGSLVDVIPLDLARDRRFGGIVRVSTPIPTPPPPPPPHPLDNRIRRSRATASSPLSTPSTIASSLPSSISVILFPIAVTFYITWWFIHFVDGFFSPIYAQLSINILGLGFITSITFIFLVGLFMSSWVGASLLSLGEWFIKRMPFVCHIYNASKQISTAISPDQNTQAFKEVAIIRHPRIGEYTLDSLLQQLFFRNPVFGKRTIFTV
ncbi:protein CONTINUOUS VASCULAR RING 1-like [Ananas comosus]|uniref:Protein CONTINUOUS VASCULAR RING 1-like n=1 Tax=Ananas comosus TaxID=4615 RepID=A0A6P5FGB1_ANACO|nr:protein CONTINUOUS VASCULAR RING 1-like [Ananas comosus]